MLGFEGHTHTVSTHISTNTNTNTNTNTSTHGKHAFKSFFIGFMEVVHLVQICQAITKSSVSTVMYNKHASVFCYSTSVRASE